MMDINTESSESSVPVRQTTFAGAVSAIAGRQTAFTLPENSARQTMFGKMPTEGSAGMPEKSQTSMPFGKSLPLSTPSSRKTQHDSSHAHHAEKSHTVRQTTFGSHPPEGSKSEKLSEKNVRHTTFMPTHPTTASQLLEGIGEAAHVPANKPHAHFEPGHGHHGHQGHQGHDHERNGPKGRESLMAAFSSPGVRFTMVKNRLTQHHAHHSPRSDHKDSEAGSGSNSMGLSVKPKKTQHDSHHDHHADTEAGTESGDKSMGVKHVEPPKPRGSMFHKAASLLMKSKS